MNVQKFVAWDKLPSLYPQADAQESSSSSSKTGSFEETGSETFQKVQDTESTVDMTVLPVVNIPHSVKNVLNKIDTAQLERAKKDISKKLLHIQDKVRRVYEHYKKDDGFDPDLEREYFRTATWEETSRRSNLLDEITDSLAQSALKEKELEMVLESLKAWSEMMKRIALKEKVLPSEEWIEEAEKSLLKHFHAIQEHIQYLIKLCCPLLKEREKMRRKSAVRASLFKAWRDKVAEKPDLADPLTAEQMVEDEVLTFSLTHEVNEMILEIADLSFFNKGEVTAIKYIASVVANLTKAFGFLSRQCRSLKIKLEVGVVESRKQDPQVTSLQRELRMIIEKKAALEMQVHNAEERCKMLLTTNEAMQKELRSAYERAQLKEASFGRLPLSQVPHEKATVQVDAEKNVSKTVSIKQLPKSHPPAGKGPGLETEESLNLGETRKLKYESVSSDSEKVLSVLSTSETRTPLAQDTQIQRVMKVQETETVSQEIVPQKSAEETAPLGKKPVLEFSIEKVVESTKKLEGQRDPTALQDLKLHEKTKLQKPQLARDKSVTETYSSQSSGAGSQGRIQEITSDGEPSPQSSARSVRTTGVKEDIHLPAEKALPEPPTEKTRPPSLQRNRQPTGKKPSLKDSVEQVIQALRLQKQAKLQGGISVQVPLTAPDSREKMDAELPEGSASQKPLRITEDIEPESQDADKMQAQNQQIDQLQEKKEMKGPRSMLVERPTDVSEEGAEKRQQGKMIRDVIHDLGTQLQEIARKKGGVIEEETIKELFEELDMTSEDEILGQMYGSLPADKAPKAPIVKRLERHVSTSEKTSKSRDSIDEASCGQDMEAAMQEFQTFILASIDDKLGKLKKFPAESLKQPKTFKPTNPQVQQLYQAIDRKLDECFSAMKHKYRGAMVRRRIPSQGSEEEEKEIRLLSTSGTLSVSSQESSVTSLSPSEGEEQQMPRQRRKLSKQRHKPKRKVQAASPDPQKQQEKREGASKYPHPQEGEPFLLPEVVLQVHEGDMPAKEAQDAEVPGLPASEMGQGQWFLHLQERLEGEKGRLEEEQARLQEERIRLDDEEQYLGHWQQLFETLEEQWSQKQQQQLEQELLWGTQLEHWQQLKREHEEQEQYWRLQQEQHQERLHQLQEELQKLQRQCEQQVLLQQEQTEEQGRWDRLRALHEEQLRTWQQEDEEREKQRSQWQQQLADHEAWREEKTQQELQYKTWQKGQWEQLQAQERLWQQRCQQQQQRWRHQVQQHRTQQHKQQTQLQKVQERQKQLWKEERILAPQLKMLQTRVQGKVAKEIQWQEPREPSPIRLEPPTCKAQRLSMVHKDHLLPATRKAGLLPTTPQLSPEPSKEYSDSLDRDSTLFPKAFPREDGFPAPGVTEKRYSLNVEAQRKNLKLLEEANQKAGLASDLYIKAKETIVRVLHSNVERLALLFQKYIAFRRLQETRRILMAKLDAAKDDKDSATIKKLYTFVERLDAHKKKVLENWTSDQKMAEKKRQHNIENMIVLFDQLHLSNRLQLSRPRPLMIKAAGTAKETQLTPHIGPVYLRSKVYRSPLFAMKKPIAISAIVRGESSEQTESLWQTDITELSIPLGPKTPVSLLLSQACGFPDIPRLMELDITSLRNKPLQEIKTRTIFHLSC